jgi:hypothetical protein
MATQMSHQKRKELIADYQTGLYSNVQLAIRYGVTNATVRNVLMRAGVYVEQRTRQGTAFASRGTTLNKIRAACDSLMHTDNLHDLWLGILSIKQYAEIGVNQSR